MVALIIIFPNIVSYGDDAQREMQRLEREGKAPELDLEAMMNKAADENESSAEEQTDSDFLKQLQSNDK
jgi:chromosome condensin MukBEF MukE localization factor